MFESPSAEHAWLDRLVGSWKGEMECPTAPGQEPIASKINEEVRSLGGLWILAEGTGEMPNGASSKSLFTFGYDPKTKLFVGTFVASMMTYLWKYSGSLNVSQTILSLNTEGPRFSDDGKTDGMAQYIDAIEFLDDNTRTLTSSILNPDGSWTSIMTARYQRI